MLGSGAWALVGWLSDPTLRLAGGLFWLTTWYFLAAAPPPRHGHVPGRYPGVALLAGLLLAPFWKAGAIALVALGALSGLATFSATLWRSKQAPAVVGD